MVRRRQAGVNLLALNFTSRSYFMLGENAVNTNPVELQNRLDRVFGDWFWDRKPIGRRILPVQRLSSSHHYCTDNAQFAKQFVTRYVSVIHMVQHSYSEMIYNPHGGSMPVSTAIRRNHRVQMYQIKHPRIYARQPRRRIYAILVRALFAMIEIIYP
jgi:hypothetical protein